MATANIRLCFAYPTYMAEALKTSNLVKAGYDRLRDWFDGAVDPIEAKPSSEVAFYRPTHAVRAAERKKLLFLRSLIDNYRALAAAGQLPPQSPSVQDIDSQLRSSHPFTDVVQRIYLDLWHAGARLAALLDSPELGREFHGLAREQQLDFLYTVCGSLDSSDVTRLYARKAGKAMAYEAWRRELVDLETRQESWDPALVEWVAQIGRDYVALAKQIRAARHLPFGGGYIDMALLPSFDLPKTTPEDLTALGALDATLTSPSDLPALATLFELDICFNVPLTTSGAPDVTPGTEADIGRVTDEIAQELSNGGFRNDLKIVIDYDMVQKSLVVFFHVQGEEVLEELRALFDKVAKQKLTSVIEEQLRDAIKAQPLLLNGLTRKRRKAFKAGLRQQLWGELHDKLGSLEKAIFVDAVLNTAGAAISIQEYLDTDPTKRTVWDLLGVLQSLTQPMGNAVESYYYFVKGVDPPRWLLIVGAVDVAVKAVKYLRAANSDFWAGQDSTAFGNALAVFSTFFQSAALGLAFAEVTAEVWMPLMIVGGVIVAIAGLIQFFGHKTDLERWFTLCFFGDDFDRYQMSFSSTHLNAHWYSEDITPDLGVYAGISDAGRYYLELLDAITWRRARVVTPDVRAQAATLFGLCLPIPIEVTSVPNSTDKRLEIKAGAVKDGSAVGSALLEAGAIIRISVASESTPDKLLYQGAIEVSSEGDGGSIRVEATMASPSTPDAKNYLQTWEAVLPATALDSATMVVVELQPSGALQRAITSLANYSFVPRLLDGYWWKRVVPLGGEG